jgi:HCOMODA/2-hydroxy-3-carboxy-muconic semialdehyde decarboxylase
VDNHVQQAASEVAHAGQVLSGLGLVTAFGHVSARAGDRMLITPAADLATVTAGRLIEVELDAAVLPPGAPAEARGHLAVYAARPDVAAIARAQPPPVFAAAAALAGAGPAAGADVPAAARPAAGLPLIYGQAAWLGEMVPVHHDARLLRSAGRAAAAAATLSDSDALLLRGNGALTCGVTPGLAVARMWLLASACQAWLIAAAAGQVAVLSPAEIESWRAVQRELLPRLWDHLSESVTMPRTRSSSPQGAARG